MNILVTGVSRGVGLALTNRLIADGHTVYGISSSKTQGIDDLLKNSLATFKWKQFDLSNVANIHQVIFKEWIGHEVQIDGFVNNAAMAYDDIITNINIERLEKMYRVNVFSPLVLTKYCLRQMLLHKNKGSIVHLSSISVHTGYKGLGMYASTKGALEAFSKNTSREWGERGIRSNCLVAGFMDTSMSATLSNEQKNRIYKRTSMKVPTEISSVVDTVCYLLSDGAKSITGQNIFVDSGTI